MNILLFRQLKLVLLLTIIIIIPHTTNAQGVDNWLKQESNIQKYFLDDLENESVYKNRVDTRKTNDQSDDYGVVDSEYFSYELKSGNYGEGPTLGMQIILYKSKSDLNKRFEIISKKNQIFQYYDTHTFIIDDKALVYFNIADEDESESIKYLKLLNHYRQRLNARLLIPPELNINEREYFYQWSENLRKRY